MTLVSVAEIQMLEDLRIADFSKVASGKTEFDLDFCYCINNELSKGEISYGDYIFSQFIAEYCKNKGFDGMKFKSSFNKFGSGNNVTIFNFSKCKPINSKLYFIENVTVNYRHVEK